MKTIVFVLCLFALSANAQYWNPNDALIIKKLDTRPKDFYGQPIAPEEQERMDASTLNGACHGACRDHGLNAEVYELDRRRYIGQGVWNEDRNESKEDVFSDVFSNRQRRRH